MLNIAQRHTCQCLSYTKRTSGVQGGRHLMDALFSPS